MAGQKTFTYKIVTVVNQSPLVALQKTLASINISLNTISINFTKLGSTVKNSMGTAKGGVNDLTNSIKNLALAFGALGVAKFAIGGAVDFGKKVIEAGKFRQSAVLGLEQSYAGRGESIFGDLINIANKTPADTKPLLEFANSLSPALKGNEEVLKKLTLLRADFEAKGAPQSVLDSLTSVLLTSLGGAKPEVTADAIQKVGGKQKYLEALGKVLGITETNPALLNKAINNAANLGKISASAYTQAYVNFSNEYLGQSKIGETSLRMASGSIAGALSNFNSVLDNMLFTTKLEDMPGIKAFTGVLNKVTEILTSKEFQRGLEDIITNIFKPFTSLTSEQIFTKMMLFKDLLIGISKVLGELADRLLKIFTAGSVTDALKQTLVGLKDLFRYIGAIIGQGVRAAFFGGGQDIINSFEGNKGSGSPGSLNIPDNGQKIRVGGIFIGSDDLQAPQPVKPFRMDQDIHVPGQFSVVNNVTVHGNGDANQIANAVGGATTKSIENQSQKKLLRQAGKSK